MAHTPDIFGSSIVAVGSFNPAIFTPDWLERNELLGHEDAEAVREGQGRSLLISREATTFETKWFALQVLQNQFSLTSKDALTPAFKDLAVGIFELVPHTPVTAIGLNFTEHYKLQTEQEFHRLGDFLVPKTIWNELFSDIAVGMRNLTIEVQPWKRYEAPTSKDLKRISVQPSALFRFGAFLAYNAHFEMSSGKEDRSETAGFAATIIDREWENAWKDAVRVFDRIVAKASAA